MDLRLFYFHVTICVRLILLQSVITLLKEKKLSYNESSGVLEVTDPILSKSLEKSTHDLSTYQEFFHDGTVNEQVRTLSARTFFK